MKSCPTCNQDIKDPATQELVAAIERTTNWEWDHTLGKMRELKVVLEKTAALGEKK